MKKRHNRGFTLAEMLIIVGIIAVLVAIAVPAFLEQYNDAQRAACEDARRGMRAEMAARLTALGEAQADVPATQQTVFAEIWHESCPSGGVYTLEPGTRDTFYITCTVHNGSAPAASSAASASPAGVSNVTVAPSAVTLYLSGGNVTKKLTAGADPNGADDSVTWKSSNPSIASVTDDGEVIAQAVGTATIIATSTADPIKSAACIVTVKERKATVTRVTVEPSACTLTTLPSGNPVKLFARVTMSDGSAYSGEVHWTIPLGSEGIVTVENDGTVTAVAAGTVNVIATVTGAAAEGAAFGACTVTVTEAAP